MINKIMQKYKVEVADLANSPVPLKACLFQGTLYVSKELSIEEALSIIEDLENGTDKGYIVKF